MPHAVITGSSRGIGFGMAREFLKQGYSVTISGSTDLSTLKAAEKLKLDFSDTQIIAVTCDVRKSEDIARLWQESAKAFETVDIWVNNAGLGQRNEYFWNLEPEEIDALTDVNIKGLIHATAYAYRKMYAQGHGKIYNMEGLGSQGRMMPKVEIYGTTKRAVNYFTQSFAKEMPKGNVVVGAISPGMVVTDLLLKPIGEDSPDRDRFERIVNILGDRVETVTPFLVKQMIHNTKNGKSIRWLSGRKIIERFILSLFKKRKII